MRILFVSASPIKKEISIGNTFLNLFDGMEDVEFASIYTRAGQPDAAVSQSFCITEKMLIRNLLGKGPAGKKVEPEERPNSETQKETSKGVTFAKTHRWTLFFWLQDFVWRIGRWKSKELEAFIREYEPDVVFTVLSNTPFLNRLILHVQHVAKVPLVIYAWDNNYSMKRLMFSPLKWINHILNRRLMRKVVRKADLFYAISDVQKNDYEKTFCRQCKIITKGEDFVGNVPAQAVYNKPLQMIYTGNIGSNRWKSLAHIVNVLERMNQDGFMAQLRIYSGTEITDKMRKALHKGESSFLMGSVSAGEVAKLQQEADVLIHVEAMDLKNRLLYRQSFSTKLVDYFHQAKAIVAYGPKDVASMAYLIKHNAAIIAQTEQELDEKLGEVLKKPELLQDYGERAWMCGRANHQRASLQAMLYSDLVACICDKADIKQSE